MWYKIDDDGYMMTSNAQIDSSWKYTDKEIVYGIDGRLYFKGEEPTQTIEVVKASKLSEINAAYNTATSSLVSTYPDTELLSFDKQEAEARAWSADNSTSTPLIDALALGRGIDKSELIRRIIAKADAFAVATGYLTGQRQKYEDQLEAATTAEEVEAIVPEYTMPETTTEKVKLSLYYDL